jgi:hypothetical protein
VKYLRAKGVSTQNINHGRFSDRLADEEEKDDHQEWGLSVRKGRETTMVLIAMELFCG